MLVTIGLVNIALVEIDYLFHHYFVSVEIRLVGDYLFGCYFMLVEITVKEIALVEIALMKDYLFGGHFAVEN